MLSTSIMIVHMCPRPCMHESVLLDALLCVCACVCALFPCECALIHKHLSKCTAAFPFFTSASSSCYADMFTRINVHTSNQECIQVICFQASTQAELVFFPAQTERQRDKATERRDSQSDRQTVQTNHAGIHTYSMPGTYSFHIYN
jgi:hypothetical protein